MYRRWDTLRIIGVLLIVLTASPAGAETRSAYPTPLAVRVDDIRISEGIVALTRGGDVFLPVRELALALEFPVELNPGRTQASGWFLDRSLRYRIDAANGRVSSEDRSRSFGSDAFLSGDGASGNDLYVRPEVLEYVWPLSLSVSRTDLVLTVSPGEPLPIQQRRKRQQRREDLRARERSRGTDVPLRAHPYGWLRPPVVGIDLQASSGPGGDHYRQRLRWSQEVAGVNVFGGLTASGSNEQSNELRDARLTLRRFADTEPLPGGFEQIAVGDVSGETFGRVGSVGAGRGVSLSSFPLARGNAFDRHRIEGNAPSGWDAELYRDGRLIDFLEVGNDGRYRFDGVDLAYGSNRFRVVLYGPQGQRRVRDETVDVGQTQARAGETHMRLDHVEAGRDFIPIDGEDEDVDTEPGTSVRLVHGLNRHLSLEAGAIALPADGTRPEQRYALLGAAGTLGATATRLRVLGQADGGVGLDLESSLRTGAASIRMGLGLFDGFTSPRVGYGDAALRGDLDLSVRGPVSLGDGNIWLGGRYGLGETVAGERRHQVDLTQRWNTGRIAWNNEIRYRRRGAGSGRWSGRLSASDRWFVGGGNSVMWGADLGYEQDAGVTDGRLRTRYRLGRAVTAGLDVHHTVDTGRTTAGIDITREWRNARLSLTADGGEGIGSTLGFRYSIGFGPRGDSGYTLTDSTAPQRGALAVHAFVDRDGDGTYDADEPPVSDAALTGAAGQDRTTDEDGRLVMYDLEAHRQYAVALERDSLVNPLWLPATQGKRITVRPGSVPVVELPVEETGSVSGTVRLGPDGPEATGIPLRLVDPSGRTVATTESVFGGFFSFERVPYDRYSLQLDDAQGYALAGRASDLTLDRVAPMATDVALNVKAVSTVAESGEVDDEPASAFAQWHRVIEGAVFVTGEPGDDVMVRLRDSEGRVVREMRSGRDGRYRFEDLRPGEYEVFVRGGTGRSARTVTLTRANSRPPDVQLIADGGAWSNGIIKGTVSNADRLARSPVEGRRIRLLDGRGQVIRQARSGVDGAFRFEGLPTGHYDVHLSGDADTRPFYVRNVRVDPTAPVASGINPSVRSDSGAREEPGRRLESHAESWTGGAISGRVSVEEDGRRSGVGGARLRLLDTRGQVVGQTVTARNGKYRFAGLKAGRYDIHLPGKPETRPFYIRNILIEQEEPIIDNVDMLMHDPIEEAASHDESARGMIDDQTVAADDRETADPSMAAAWLSDAMGARYTIQVAGLRTVAAAKAFIRRHDLAGRALYGRTTHAGAPWYPVLIGSYATRVAARAALEDLPADLRADSPWIRRGSDVVVEEPKVSGACGGTDAGRASDGWVAGQPPFCFTIQLIAASREQAVRRFIEEKGLEGRAIYVESTRKGDSWFSVLYGVFGGRAAARDGLDALPEGIERNQVWIRSFGDIRADMGDDGA